MNINFWGTVESTQFYSPHFNIQNHKHQDRHSADSPYHFDDNQCEKNACYHIHLSEKPNSYTHKLFHLCNHELYNIPETECLSELVSDESTSKFVSFLNFLTFFLCNFFFKNIISSTSKIPPLFLLFMIYNNFFIYFLFHLYIFNILIFILNWRLCYTNGNNINFICNFIMFYFYFLRSFERYNFRDDIVNLFFLFRAIRTIVSKIARTHIRIRFIFIRPQLSSEIFVVDVLSTSDWFSYIFFLDLILATNSSSTCPFNLSMSSAISSSGLFATENSSLIVLSTTLVVTIFSSLAKSSLSESPSLLNRLFILDNIS
ncbi:hypothetical protein AGLY_016150 [Aphis glycines]|uniref:Uncharacterized protein n=1 Tax=Aphis glycines TaxID=307491 RepID=A0A6G0SZM1_APHGL|nr:hypothetical protein AGLY_016150 [Aphis glycines]